MSHNDPAPTTPPPACHTCQGPRTWDIDPADTDAECFAWRESCAAAEFVDQTHPVHTEPVISEPHARMIVFTWQLGEIGQDGRVGTAIGELVVSHPPQDKAFRASLRSGVRLATGGTRYRYRLGHPGWHLDQPIARYSRPRLLAYAARALAALREVNLAQIVDVFPTPSSMTDEQASVVLWSSDNGEISCADHGGSYLRCAVEARPTARAHRTPLGTWERLGSGEVAELARMIGRPVTCETCTARSQRQ